MKNPCIWFIKQVISIIFAGFRFGFECVHKNIRFEKIFSALHTIQLFIGKLVMHTNLNTCILYNDQLNKQ